MTPPNHLPSLATDAHKYESEPVRFFRDNSLAGLEVIEHQLPEGMEPAQYAALMAQTLHRAH